jgi:hypothetical protein
MDKLDQLLDHFHEAIWRRWQGADSGARINDARKALHDYFQECAGQDAVARREPQHCEGDKE